MYVALTDQERDLLQGRDYVLTVLYIHLKSFMDYKSGVVGYARRISYQGISEALYIEPRQGVKGGSPHKSSIRRMIDQLLQSGIIKKSRSDTLVFKLPYADTDNYGQNKADTKSTPKADTTQANKQANLAPKADTPKKAKADTPHLSLNTINKPTSLHNNVIDETAKDDHDEKLIFNKSLHQDLIEQMKKQLEGFHHERQQELLDELSFYISKNKIQVSPASLFMAMVKGARAGTFIAANAHIIKKQREAVQVAAEQKRPALTAEQRQVSKTKGKAKMAEVMNIFKHKGAKNEAAA